MGEPNKKRFGIPCLSKSSITAAWSGVASVVTLRSFSSMVRLTLPSCGIQRRRLSLLLDAKARSYAACALFRLSEVDVSGLPVAC